MIKVFSRFTALIVWVLAIMVFNPMQSHAVVGDTFTIDQLKYVVLTEEDTSGTAAVSGYVGEPTTITISDSVSHDGKTYSVTSLGDEAFNWCDSLIELTIPASVTSIAKNAFSACFSLEQVYYEGNVPETQPGLYDAAPDTLISYYKNMNKTSWESAIIDNKWQGRSIELDPKDKLEYNLFDDGTASVTGIGSFSDSNVIIPSTVIENQKTYTVISIGNKAFSGCTNLTSVTIPNSVTSIGNCAFFNCVNLSNIHVDSNNPVYSSMDGVLFNKDKTVLIQYPSEREGEYIIPESVNLIGNYAFAGCMGATSLIIPEGVEEITHNAFYKFKGLQKIQFPSTLKTIGENAFFACMNLQEINIPDSVTSIGAGAFANCKSLEQVDIPNYVKEIGDSAFYKCEKLKFAYIPDNCIYAGAYMFNYCHSLEKVIVGAGIGEIQVGFFLNCNNLREIYFLGDNPGINYDVFFVYDYLEILNRCYSPSDINPEIYIETVQNNTPIVYYLQDKLGWNITIHEYLLSEIQKHIATHSNFSYLLGNCIKYKELEIGENNFSFVNGAIVSYQGDFPVIMVPDTFSGIPVTEIGANTFENCESVYAIIIPASVNMIGDKAFVNCPRLKTVQFRGNAPEASEDIFEGDHCVVYCERGTDGWYSSWKGMDVLTIEWSTVDDFIYELSDNEITIIGYTGASPYLEIPSEINGYSVTRIAEYAFFGEKNIFRVYVPESIAYIGFAGFAGCTNLSMVVFKGNTELDNSVFCYCRNLSEVVLPKNIKSITNYAFIGCNNLKSIHISEGVVSVGDNAFSGCKNLKDAIVPDSVKNIGYNAFSECDSLPPVLFSTGGKTLIRYSAWNKDDTYVIPATVTNIACSAFFECQNLVNIVIPNGVTAIGGNAFQYCGNLTNVIVPDSIKFIGNDAFDRCDKLPPVLFSVGKKILVRYSPLNEDASYVIPNNVSIISNEAFSGCISLNSIIIPDNVIEIGEGAFTMCFNLKNISIPNSVTKIADETFSQCRNLTSVVIPNSITEIGNSAFFDCHNLTDIIIPDGIIEIGDSAFANCIALKNIVMPDSVTFIDDNAFSGCLSLKDIRIPNNLINIPDNAFSACYSLNDITIPNSVKSMGDCVFYFCENLGNVYFQGNAPELGEEVFFNTPSTVYYLEGTKGWTNTFGGCPTVECKGWFTQDGVIYACQSDKTAVVGGYIGELNSVVIPKTISIDSTNYSVTSIGDYAFSSSESLTSIIIPDNVTFIGEGAFKGCSSLTSIIIPNGVTFIGNQTFYNCSSLTSITISDSVTSIGDYAFLGCSSLPSITIPDNVTSIGNYAFYNCDSLTNIMIPNTVTYIGEDTFYNCSSLVSITLSDNVTSIGNWAFSKCSSLISITIPDSVISIGNYAFYNCSKLTRVCFKGDAPTIGSSVFSGTEATVYYKDGAEGWRNPWGGRPTVVIPPVIYNYDYHPDGTATVTGVSEEVLFFDEIKIPSTVEKDGVIYTVTAIAEKAFYGSDALTRVLIPDGVTTIGTGAFSNCADLVSVTVGKGVTFIGNGAFFGCGSLREMYFDGDAPELGRQVFFNTPATIYYQAGTEGWTNPWGDRPTVMIQGEIPVLTCALEGDMIRLQWTADADAVLQVSDNAVDDWTDVTEGIQTESGNCVYKVPTTAKQAFYRLKMP